MWAREYSTKDITHVLDGTERISKYKNKRRGCEGTVVVGMVNMAGEEAPEAPGPVDGRACGPPATRLLSSQVTVVRNLEAYGLDPCLVAAVLQQRCQASTTVTPAPGAKDSLQVQVQGNQIHHLSQLLLGEHPL